STSLLFEVIFLFNTITSSTHKKFDKDVYYELIPKLIDLLKHTSSIIAEQALYVLRNIIDTPYAREIALKYDALPHIVDIIKPDTSIMLMDDITWLLSNLCQRTEPLSLETTKHILPVLNCLLRNENEYERIIKINNEYENVTSDTCRILSYVSDGDKNNVRAIMETGILPKLLKCLASSKKSIFIPALLIVRNIVEFGDDAHKDAIIAAGGLSGLRIVLSNCFVDEEDIERESFWIIGTLAGNTDQIQSVIDAGLLPTLMNSIAGENKIIQMRSQWVLMDILSRARGRFLKKLLNAGVLTVICNNFMKVKDDDTIMVHYLDDLKDMLDAAEENGQIEKFVIILEETGVIERLRALRFHQNDIIFKRSMSFFD
ncbi:Importin subunit alpha-2, partial [Cyphomyrmex costatus]